MEDPETGFPLEENVKQREDQFKSGLENNCSRLIVSG
jgi:hypothetical protein